LTRNTVACNVLGQRVSARRKLTLGMILLRLRRSSPFRLLAPQASLGHTSRSASVARSHFSLRKRRSVTLLAPQASLGHTSRSASVARSHFSLRKRRSVTPVGPGGRSLSR